MRHGVARRNPAAGVLTPLSAPLFAALGVVISPASPFVSSPTQLSASAPAAGGAGVQVARAKAGGKFLSCGGRGDRGRGDSLGDVIIGLTLEFASILSLAGVSLRCFPYEEAVGRSRLDVRDGVIIRVVVARDAAAAAAAVARVMVWLGVVGLAGGWFACVYFASGSVTNEQPGGFISRGRTVAWGGNGVVRVPNGTRKQTWNITSRLDFLS